MEEVVGSLGVRELNTALQRVLNPVRSGEPTVERFGWRFQMGDKVIQTENDYDKDVFNGDVGIIERIDAVEQQVAVRFAALHAAPAQPDLHGHHAGREAARPDRAEEGVGHRGSQRPPAEAAFGTAGWSEGTFH